MNQLSDVMAQVLGAPDHGFTKPTWNRFVALALAALVTIGPKTITSVVTVGGLLGRGHVSSWHRIFNRPGRAVRWSLLALARHLARQVLALVPADRTVVLAVDDTATSRPGRRVYGKGCHRDAVASSHSYTTWTWGHRWVVLAVIVELPFARRPWALPVLVALYRNRETNEQEGRRHKTVLDLARQMTLMLARWFPTRRFCLTADGGFASVELARLAQVTHGRVHLISKMKPNARLFAPAPARRPGQNGRPRRRGALLPSPAKSRRRSKSATVGWYGGGTRRVTLRTGTGGWHRHRWLVPVRWVHVRDCQGTHRDDYLFTTDLTMDPATIVTLYTRRWNLETTFQELRAHHRIESTRVWSKHAVMTYIPCLIGLYTLAVIVRGQTGAKSVRPRQDPWYPKADATYSDLINELRASYWRQNLFELPREHRTEKNPQRHIIERLLLQVCRAA